jgi:photosystem II stability/assembly factor-like uncharacterized protein
MRSIILLIFFLNGVSISQWNIVEDIPDQYINTIYINENSIYAGGDTLYISNDNGSSWTSNSFSQYFVTAVIKAAGKIYAGTFGGGVYRSLDNGSTWHTYNEGFGNFTAQVIKFLVDGENLLAGTNGGGVYKTNINSNSGWVEFNEGLPSNYGYTIKDLCKTRSSIIASAGASGFYYIRSDGSDEWIERTIDTTGTRKIDPDVFFALGDTVFAGSRSGIYRSTDGGYFWDSVGISAMPLHVVSFTKSANRIYAGYSRDSDFFIWYSEDLGDSWQIFDHQFTALFNIQASGSVLWTGTSNGLWYYQLPPVSANENDPVLNFSLKQNYPNPFNPATTISYQIKENAYVLLSVFNILGEEVARLVDKEQNAGDYSIIFSAELAAGLYFSRLQAGDQSSTIKMLLVK